MTLKNKIALIEISTDHEECLFSQLQFLTNAKYNVTLIINPKNTKNIPYYNIKTENVKLFDPRSSKFFLIRFINFLKLYGFLTKNNFGKIVFNTASSNKEVIALTRFLPKHIDCYGIIHNLKKLNSSTSQKLISRRIKEYFVLNDFLKDSVEVENKEIKLHSFYPIFFPNYDTININKKDDDYWVCIPGELNYNRRDYNLILEALADLVEVKNLKIIILGKLNDNSEVGKTFVNHVNSKKLQPFIVTFKEYISNEIFHGYLKKSDFIMAPVSLTEKNYLKYKITGAYNLAFAYQKTLICPQELSIIPDLKTNSFFYSNKSSLIDLFSNISKGIITEKTNYENPKWDFKYQQKKYLELLEK